MSPGVLRKWLGRKLGSIPTLLTDRERKNKKISEKPTANVYWQNLKNSYRQPRNFSLGKFFWENTYKKIYIWGCSLKHDLIAVKKMRGKKCGPVIGSTLNESWYFHMVECNVVIRNYGVLEFKRHWKTFVVYNFFNVTKQYVSLILILKICVDMWNMCKYIKYL